METKRRLRWEICLYFTTNTTQIWLTREALTVWGNLKGLIFINCGGPWFLIISGKPWIAENGRKLKRNLLLNTNIIELNVIWPKFCFQKRMNFFFFRREHSRGCIRASPQKHSHPPLRKCKKIQSSFWRQKHAKLITYPKIQSQTTSKQLLYISWYVVLQILSASCGLETFRY